MDGLDGLAQALGITDRKDADWHVLAKVSAVNQDGTLTVYMGGSLNPTTVEAYCDAQAGDVVCVMISKGKARAIARRGGSVRGTSVDSLWDSGSTSSVGALNLSIDWSPYKALLITVYSPTGAASYAHYETNVVDVDYTPARIIGNRELPFFRTVTLSPGTVSIGECYFYSQYNTSNPTVSNDYCIPVSIKGVY